MQRERMLWADVPPWQRYQRATMHEPRCRYAVPCGFHPGFTRCAQPVKDGEDVCVVHRGESRAHTEEATLNRIRRCLRYTIESVAELRMLTDDEILNIRMVGVGLAARIREIRDTWSDERLADFLGLAPTLGTVRRPLEQYRSDIVEAGACNWVGEGVPVMVGG